MTLRITDTGTPINQELMDYINQRFDGIYFDEISIELFSLETAEQEDTFKEKVVEISYPGIGLLLRNTICLTEQDLNENIIDWLKTL